MHTDIGGYRPSDLEFVAAFELDVRKVGTPLEEAVFAAPNCAQIFAPELLASRIDVEMGSVLDGVAPHMASDQDSEAIRVSEQSSVEAADVLRRTEAQVLVLLSAGRIRISCSVLCAGLSRCWRGDGQLRAGVHRFG